MTQNLRVTLKTISCEKFLIWFSIFWISCFTSSYNLLTISTNLLIIFILYIYNIYNTSKLVTSVTNNNYNYNLYLLVASFFKINKINLIKHILKIVKSFFINRNTTFIKNNYNIGFKYFWYPLFKKNSYYGYSRATKVLNIFFKK
jgi:hypothetical protein